MLKFKTWLSTKHSDNTFKIEYQEDSKCMQSVSSVIDSVCKQMHQDKEELGYSLAEAIFRVGSKSHHHQGSSSFCQRSKTAQISTRLVDSTCEFLTGRLSSMCIILL